MRDVESLIEFIGERGVATSSRQGNLPAHVLPELNTRLAAPIEVKLNRPLLRDYPNIAGPFVLLRAMDLAPASEKRVWIDAEALALWRGLNPVEKYFALLEAWLFRAEAQVLGGHERYRLNQFTANLMFLAKLGTSRWKSFGENCHLYEFLGAVSTWNTQLHARFGLIEVQPRARAKRHGWCMEKCRRTPWGQAVAWAILERVTAGGEGEEVGWLLGAPEDADFGFLQPAFRPYFPEWKTVFAPAHAAPLFGVHVFKVTLTDARAKGDVWRRLTVPGNASLDEMAGAVLDAFRFEDTEGCFRRRRRSSWTAAARTGPISASTMPRSCTEWAHGWMRSRSCSLFCAAWITANSSMWRRTRRRWRRRGREWEQV